MPTQMKYSGNKIINGVRCTWGYGHPEWVTPCGDPELDAIPTLFYHGPVEFMKQVIPQYIQDLNQKNWAVISKQVIGPCLQRAPNCYHTVPHERDNCCNIEGHDCQPVPKEPVCQSM